MSKRRRTKKKISLFSKFWSKSRLQNLLFAHQSVCDPSCAAELGASSSLPLSSSSSSPSGPLFAVRWHCVVLWPHRLSTFRSYHVTDIILLSQFDFATCSQLSSPTSPWIINVATRGADLSRVSTAGCIQLGRGACCQSGPNCLSLWSGPSMLDLVSLVVWSAP